MPKHLFPPLAESFRIRLRDAIEPLLENAQTDAPILGVESAREVLDSLPLTIQEFCVAINRLASAQRYLVADERGAACFELRLLLRSLAK
jgi:hypothetical protein